MKIIIWIKASVAFLVPFLTGFALAAQPYVGADAAQPTFAGWLVLICAPLVAGLSALSSFLSKSYADHVDSLTPPAPIAAPIIPQPQPAADVAKQP
jgi:hypothetical protein